MLSGSQALGRATAERGGDDLRWFGKVRAIARDLEIWLPLSAQGAFDREGDLGVVVGAELSGKGAPRFKTQPCRREQNVEPRISDCRRDSSSVATTVKRRRHLYGCIIGASRVSTDVDEPHFDWTATRADDPRTPARSPSETRTKQERTADSDEAQTTSGSNGHNSPD
jgi:hypothetical protein